jgi:hypothetical protein
VKGAYRFVGVTMDIDSLSAACRHC